MRKLFSLFLALVASMLVSVSVWANMAAPGMYRMETQPDGTQVKVFIHGDEWYNYMTDSLGNVFEQDERGLLKRDSRGFLINTRRKMTSEEVSQRRKARAQQMGQFGPRKIGAPHELPRVLVLLVQYNDTTFHEGNNTREAWDDFFNKEGYDFEGANGSVRDYFIAQSGGKFKPQFDVYGPVTVDHPWSWTDYRANGSTGDRRASNLIAEACEQLDDEIDFSIYDTDDDGKVDIVYLIYAGYSYSPDGIGIWPHHSLRSESFATYDDKQFFEYSCTGEMLKGYKRAGIGTMCHEFSHALGFPDYYDTNYGSNGSNNEVPNYWALMSRGDHLNDGLNPPNYSIYDKYYMGWETPKLLKTGENITLEPSVSGYCLTKNGKLPAYNYTDTVYYIENRQHQGFDSKTPGHGLLVWRVIYDQYRWTNNGVNAVAGQTGMTLVASSGKKGGYGNPTWDRPYGITEDNLEAFPGDSSTTEVTLFGTTLTGITEESNGNVTFSADMGGALKAKPKDDKYATDYSTKSFAIRHGDSIAFKAKVTGNGDINTTLVLKVARHTLDGKWSDFQAYKWEYANREDVLNGFVWETDDGTDTYKNCDQVCYQLDAVTVVDGKPVAISSNKIYVYFRYHLKFVEENGDIALSKDIEPGTKDIVLGEHVSSCNTYEMNCTQEAKVSVKDGKAVLEQMPCADVTVRTRSDLLAYYVYFFDYDGSTLKTQVVKCGSDATPPANPSYKGMEFVRWEGNYKDVHGNCYVYAVYKGGTGHFVDIELAEHTCGELKPFTADDYRDAYFKGSDRIALTRDRLVFRFKQDAEDGGIVYFNWTDTFDENGEPVWTSSVVSEAGKLTKEEALAKKELLYTYDICNNPLACTDEKTFVNKMAFRFFYNSGGNNYHTEPIVFDIYYPFVFRFKKSDNIRGMVLTHGEPAFYNYLPLTTELNDYYYEWIPARNQDSIFCVFTNTDSREIVPCLDFKRLRYPKTWQSIDSGEDPNGWFYIVQQGFIDTIAIEKKLFTVSFKYWGTDEGGNKVLRQTEQKVLCGDAAEPPVIDDIYWPFAGWLNQYAHKDNEQVWLNIQEDMEYQADYIYPPDPVYYTVKFVDKDFNTIVSKSVLAFDDVVPPSVVPEFVGWHFVRWDGKCTNVTEDRVIRAVYGQNDVFWKINYYNWDSDWLGEELVEDGHAATQEGIYPYRTGHKFNCWSVMPLNEIRKDMSVFAVFDDAEVPTHKVTVIAENGTVEVTPKSVDLDHVNEGTIILLTPIPDEGCEFRGWENYDVERGLTVIKDITVTAKFVRVKARTFTVEFFDHTNNILLKSEEVEEGKTATAPEPPALEKHTFTGWEQNNTGDILSSEQVNVLPITEDLMFKATYKENPGTDIDQSPITNYQSPIKVLRDGILYIERNGQLYTITGQKVK